MWNKAIFLLAALGLLLSCGKQEEGKREETPEPLAVSITFAQNPLIVGADAAVVDCGLSCNAAWKASSKDAWVTVLTPQGDAGGMLQVNVAANSGETSRNATVTVSAGSEEKVLQLAQKGKVSTSLVSETSISLDTYGTGTYITIQTEKEWTWTEPDASWLTLEKKGPAALGLSADINFTGEPRSAVFTVSSTDGTLQSQLTVTQQFSNEKFLASTEYGRKLVYAMGSYIKSVTSDTYRQLTDGVSSYEMSCTLTDSWGKENAPKKRNIFLFEVDMTRATILATLKDDDNANIKSRIEMSQQISALQSHRPNLTVWGGTNGDFFDEDEEGSEIWTLQGVLYRGGTCLKNSFAQTINTVFAVFKDGTAKSMSQAEYNTVSAQIQEAIGGRQHLIKGGVIVDFPDTDAGHKQDPRTAVGTSANGKTVWILVVDGRQEQHATGSYSVSYDVIARILKAAGARDAINLDGGGSSTFIVRKASGDTFEMRNKPSNTGRTERAVLDGLAIVTNN